MNQFIFCSDLLLRVKNKLSSLTSLKSKPKRTLRSSRRANLLTFPHYANITDRMLRTMQLKSRAQTADLHKLCNWSDDFRPNYINQHLQFWTNNETYCTRKRHDVIHCAFTWSLLWRHAQRLHGYVKFQIVSSLDK